MKISRLNSVCLPGSLSIFLISILVVTDWLPYNLFSCDNFYFTDVLKESCQIRVHGQNIFFSLRLTAYRVTRNFLTKFLFNKI